MANLCIKTPSSASYVLIFQLLVLRPRPNVQVNSHKRMPKGAGAKFVFWVLYPSLHFPHDEQSKNWRKMASPLVLCSAGLKYIHREALSQNDLSCSYRVVWANITILIGQNVKLINIFSVDLWLFTSCDSISFLSDPSPIIVYPCHSLTH